MFERFTEEAHAAALASWRIALEQRQEFVSPMHVLLGCARSMSYGRTLMEAGLFASSLQATLREGSYIGDPRYDRAVVLMFERSVHEAFALSSQQVNVGHVLLALLDADDEEVTGVFARLNVDALAIREAVETQLQWESRSWPV